MPSFFDCPLICRNCLLLMYLTCCHSQILRHMTALLLLYGQNNVIACTIFLHESRIRPHLIHSRRKEWTHVDLGWQGVKLVLVAKFDFFFTFLASQVAKISLILPKETMQPEFYLCHMPSVENWANNELWSSCINELGLIKQSSPFRGFILPSSNVFSQLWLFLCFLHLITNTRLKAPVLCKNW